MALETLGWDPAWEAASRALDPGTAAVIARIVAEHRGAYHASGPGGVAWCEATGHAFHVAADKRALPTVGDWVHLERWTEALAGAGAAVIREILPRRNLLVRRAAGEATVPQPLAANLDVGLVMTSANGELSPARLDRYLALLRDSGIPAVLVLSKIDLVADPAALLATLDPTVPVISLSTITGAGLDEIRARVGPRTTAVLLGSSGVGKSSLLNALMPAAVQLTQPIRDDDRGRHTTTRRELFRRRQRCADGSDTPGMREPPAPGSRPMMTTSPRTRSMTSRRSPSSASFATASTAPSPAARSAMRSRPSESHELSQARRRSTRPAW